MRKPLLSLTLAAGLLATGGLAARAAVDAEPIPAEFLQQFVPFAIQIIQQQFPNPPVKVDPNADKATGYHVQETVGLVALPDKNLTAKAVEGAGEKDVPVAVIATRALTLQDKDANVPNEKVAVADLNMMFKVPVFFIGAKGNGEERTLHVYGKDGTPLTSTPLRKAAVAGDEPLSLKLSNIDLEKKKADLTVGVAGAYEGTLKLGVHDF